MANNKEINPEEFLMSYNKTDYTLLRYCNYSMAIFTVMGLLGFAVLAGFWPPPPAYLSAQEIGQYYRDHSFGIRVGMTVMVTGIPFYLIWSVGLSKIMERMEGPMGTLSKMQLVGGATSALILTIPGFFWMVGAFRPEVRPDEIIQLMYDLAWLTFDIPFLFFGLQYIGFGIAVLLDDREVPLFPKWLAWLGFATEVSFVSTWFIPFLQRGPLAWHGLITFWVVFVIFFVFLLAVMFKIPAALKRLEAEDIAKA